MNVEMDEALGLPLEDRCDLSLETALKNVGPIQKRIAQLKAAGVPGPEIARLLEVSSEVVTSALQNQRVQRLILKLAAFTVEDLRPMISEVNAAIASDAMEAHEAQVDVLRFTRRFMYKEAADVKMDHRLRAASTCAQVAQDMQERAGASAPKKIEHRNLNVDLSGEAAANIMNALRELDEVDSAPYIPVITGPQKNGDGGLDV